MKPKCTKEMYTLYVLSEPGQASCNKFAEVMGDMSHDAVTRFLHREQFTARDLFDENREYLHVEGCQLQIDDTVISKPFSVEAYNDLIRYQYSGREHRVVKGIGLVTIFCTDKEGRRFPVNFRIFGKDSKTTKNDLLREMVDELLEWGIKPAIVSGDSWYSGLENLKYFRSQGIAWAFGIKSNRIVSETAHNQQQVQELSLPAEGKVVYLKGYGMVKVFRRESRNGAPNHYAVSLIATSDEEFTEYHRRHWDIEEYHRVLKQVCNLDGCMLREKQGQLTHFFCCLRGYSLLEKGVIMGNLHNWYRLRRELFTVAMRNFILQSSFT